MVNRGTPDPAFDVLPEQLRNRLRIAENGCWLWTGTKNGARGYGRVNVNGRQVGAHRVAYEAVRGPCPGLDVGHVCHDEDPTCPGGPCQHRLCCNPAHLQAMTRKENINSGRAPSTLAAGNRRRSESRTHCHRGHEFTEENTRRGKDGYRQCKACDRLRHLRRRGQLPDPVTVEQVRSLIGSSVEWWTEGADEPFSGDVVDVVRIGDRWHFVVKEA